MARMFLSYRRADGVASGARSLIYQKLEEYYGPKSVFMDVERMQVGRDFRECLHEEVTTTDVILLLIGPDWERIIIERAEQESDFVRIEIETALELEKPILPLLLGGAKMPLPDKLPESIRSFAWNHGVELDTGRYFNEGMERLVADLDEHVFKGVVQYKPRPKPKRIAAIAAVALIVIAGGAMLIKSFLATEDVVEKTKEVAKKTVEVADNTGRIADTSEKIAKKTVEVADNTGRIADTSEKIEKNTARVADAVENATEKFAQLSKAGGTIENPVAPFEFYHNARIYELRGDYAAARKSYLGYFQFNEEKLDPYLRYLAFLKVQEGREGARDTYAVVAGRAKGFIPRYASALLWDRDRRVELLEEFKKAQPDFAAVYYHLSLEYSTARRGVQSIADRHSEKQHLEKFFEQDKAGQFVKFFIDQEIVTAWRGDATKRLEVANSVYGKMLENPVNLTWTSSSAGWHGYIAIAEPAQEIWWKTADMTDFRKNPKTQNIDQRTGKLRPSPSIPLPIKQPAITVEVKYIDRTGAERGPFKFDFKPKVSQMTNEIRILGMLRNAWISYRDYDGKLLVYFSTLMSYRGALTRIEYGIDKDVPDQEWEFPEWDKPGTALVTKDVPTFLAIPKETRFITVRLNFKDGTRTDVVKYPR